MRARILDLGLLLGCLFLGCGAPASTASRGRVEVAAPIDAEPVVWFNALNGGPDIGGVPFRAPHFNDPDAFDGRRAGRLLENGDTAYALGPLRVLVGPDGGVTIAPSFVGAIRASALCGSHWIFVSETNVIAASESYLGPLEVVARADITVSEPSFSEDGTRALLHVGREAFEFLCEDDVVVHALPQRSILDAARRHGITVVVTHDATFARHDASPEWQPLNLGRDAVSMVLPTAGGLALLTNRGMRSLGPDFALDTPAGNGAQYLVPASPSAERRARDYIAMNEAVVAQGLTPSRPGVPRRLVERRGERWVFLDENGEETWLPGAFDNTPTVGVDGSIWTHRENEDGSLSTLLVLRRAGSSREVHSREVPAGMHFYAVQQRGRVFVRDLEGTEFWRSIDGGLHWTRLVTDPRVDGLFRAGRANVGRLDTGDGVLLAAEKARRGTTCTEPCVWSNVLIGHSPAAHSDQRLIGTTPAETQLNQHSVELLQCEPTGAQPDAGGPVSLLSRTRHHVSWRGVDSEGAFSSRSRALPHDSEFPLPDAPLWLHRDTALVQTTTTVRPIGQPGSEGASLRWSRRGGREIALVSAARNVRTLLRPDGSGVAVLDEDLGFRRGLAWNEHGEIIAERFINGRGQTSPAWVDGEPAFFATDEPWGERLAGEVIFLDARRGAQQVDLELRSELCSDDAAGGDLLSIPAPKRWGLRDAVVEGRVDGGEATCLRAARSGPTGSATADGEWNGWVHASSLHALVPSDRVQRVHLVPATAASADGFGQFSGRGIDVRCAARDENLAGSATLVRGQGATLRWGNLSFPEWFRVCVEGSLWPLAHNLELEELNLTLVPAAANLRPSVCSFRSAD